MMVAEKKFKTFFTDMIQDFEENMNIKRIKKSNIKNKLKIKLKL